MSQSPEDLCPKCGHRHRSAAELAADSAEGARILTTLAPVGSGPLAAHLRVKPETLTRWVTSGPPAGVLGRLRSAARAFNTQNTAPRAAAKATGRVPALGALPEPAAAPGGAS